MPNVRDMSSEDVADKVDDVLGLMDKAMDKVPMPFEGKALARALAQIVGALVINVVRIAEKGALQK